MTEPKITLDYLLTHEVPEGMWAKAVEAAQRSTVRCDHCGMVSSGYAATPHECPEPLPYETARLLASALSEPGAQPINPRLYAQIRLGLTEGKP
jgi:hypothetical protein